MDWHQHIWPPILTKERINNAIQWIHERKIRCGIQVVDWLHVKSIHQSNLIERKQPKIFQKHAPKKWLLNFNRKKDANSTGNQKKSPEMNRVEFGFVRNLLKYYTTILHIKNPTPTSHTTDARWRLEQKQTMSMIQRFSAIDSTVRQRAEISFFVVVSECPKFEKDTAIARYHLNNDTKTKGKTHRHNTHWGQKLILFFSFLLFFVLSFLTLFVLPKKSNHRLSFVDFNNTFVTV